MTGENAKAEPGPDRNVSVKSSGTCSDIVFALWLCPCVSLRMCCRASSPIVHSPIVHSLVALHLRGLPCLGAVALCTGTAVLSTPVPCRHETKPL